MFPNYHPLFSLLCISIIFSHSLQAQDDWSIQQLDSLAQLHFAQSEFEEALDYAQQSVQKTKEVHGTANKMYVQSLLQLARTQQMIGDYTKAGQSFDQSLTICRQQLADNKKLMAFTLLRVGHYYRVIGDFQAAERHIKETKEIYVNLYGPQSRQMLNITTSLATIYKNLRQFQQSITLLEESLDIAFGLWGKEDPEIRNIYLIAAVIYSEVNKYKKSEEYYLLAHDLVKKYDGKISNQYGRILNNMGYNYNKMGQYDKAEKLLWKSLKVRTAVLGNEHYRIGSVYANLGDAEHGRKNYKKAEEFYKKGLRIYENALGKQHRKTIGTRLKFANMYRLSEQFEKAKTEIRKILRATCIEEIDSIHSIHTLVREKSFHYPFDVRDALSYLARTYEAEYYATEKEELLKESLDVSHTLAHFIHKAHHEFSSSSDKLRLLWMITPVTFMLIKKSNMLYELTGDSTYLNNQISYAEYNKSAILNSTLNTNEAINFGGVPKDVIQKEKQLTEAVNKHKAKLLQAQSSKDSVGVEQARDALIEANMQQRDFRKHLLNDYPAYNKMKYQLNQITVNDIQEQLLDEETVLLEYVIILHVVCLFVVTKEDFYVYRIKFETTKEREELTKQLRKSLSDYKYIINQPLESGNLFKETAFKLYDKFIAPAKEHLKGKKHLIIVPDDDLGHIPFGVLLTESQKQSKKIDYAALPYLLKKYRISYSYSASLLLESYQEKIRNNNGQLIAFAAAYPKLKGLSQLRSPAQEQLRNELIALDAVKKEVQRLEKQFGNGQFYYDEKANERQFKEEANDYAVIHLAMHGILDKKHPLLSSLAFTENLDTLEDNFLEAHEISNLKLNADLVVLSACETGYGSFGHGEGVLSLARSFMYAGVPSLVVSMWQVNDLSTSKIMTLFYQNIQAGQNKAEALQKAKLDYMQSAKEVAAHPAFWAPFIQLGNPKAVSFNKTSYQMWLIGVGALILLGIGGLALRRRNKAA